MLEWPRRRRLRIKVFQLVEWSGVKRRFLATFSVLTVFALMTAFTSARLKRAVVPSTVRMSLMWLFLHHRLLKTFSHLRSTEAFQEVEFTEGLKVVPEAGLEPARF
jgi:hypothetical protein